MLVVCHHLHLAQRSTPTGHASRASGTRPARTYRTSHRVGTWTGMPECWLMADDGHTDCIEDDRLASPGRRFSDSLTVFPPQEGGYQEGEAVTEQSGRVRSEEERTA